MRPLITIAVCLLCVAAAACGSESAAVEDAVDEVSDALADGDGDEACDSLTDGAQAIVAGFRGVPPLTCSETVETLDPAAVEGCEEVEVQEVRVLSDRAAVARVSGPQGEVRIGLVNIGGRWKLRTPTCGPGIPA